MKNIIKKSIMFLIVVSTVLIPCFNAFAVEIESNGQIGANGELCVSISEYEAVKQLSGESYSALQQAGYTVTEIREIKDYKNVFSEAIRDLAELDESALVAAGYNDKQISVIKNFNGSDEEIALASAKMYISAEPEYFRYDSSDKLTKGMLSYSWYWFGVPA